jgi:hypothetical protein
VKQIAASILAALFSAGCSLAQNASEFTGPTNTCSAPSDCGDGGACVEGRCVATSYDLDKLFVEVRPHANAAFGATTSYFFDPAQAGIALTASGGAPFVARMSPTLPAFVAVREGRVRVHEKTALEMGCSIGSDRSIPAKVTFYRSTQLAGLPLSPVTATTNEHNRLDVDLVPDTYDVYIEPLVAPGCNGEQPFPPVYLRAQPITTGGALTWDLPVVGTLTGTIAGFGSAVPDGMRLDLLEPMRGLPVSGKATLENDPATDTYKINAKIAWPDADAPILRLAPETTTADEGALATVYWKLSGAVFSGTTTNPEVKLTVDQLFGKPVPVDGFVLGSDGFTGVRATLRIQSTSLKGPDANNATYAIDGIETSGLGKFQFRLPPGTYTIRATPVDNGLRITDFPGIEVPADAQCFCGQPLKLASKLELSGAVKSPLGERVQGATVSVYPAQIGAREYWNSTHTLAPIAPRVASTTTTGDGNFALLVDLGRSDVVVEPAAESGFPWLVQPRLSLEDKKDKTLLASLVITNPAILSGNVRDPNGMPVTDAEVNAWLPVRDPSADSGLAGTVVKIATASTDADGNYTLVMPSSLLPSSL